MIFNYKVFKMLGGKYKDKFEIGQYVEWRRISRNETMKNPLMFTMG